MSEKCFCHLNGYKVKDADARKDIEELKLKVNQSILPTIIDIEYDVSNNNNRITALEQGAGGGSAGGTKLYLHRYKSVAMTALIILTVRNTEYTDMRSIQTDFMDCKIISMFDGTTGHVVEVKINNDGSINCNSLTSSGGMAHSSLTLQSIEEL